MRMTGSTILQNTHAFRILACCVRWLLFRWLDLDRVLHGHNPRTHLSIKLRLKIELFLCRGLQRSGHFEVGFDVLEAKPELPCGKHPLGVKPAADKLGLDPCFT